MWPHSRILVPTTTGSRQPPLTPAGAETESHIQGTAILALTLLYCIHTVVPRANAAFPGPGRCASQLLLIGPRPLARVTV